MARDYTDLVRKHFAEILERLAFMFVYDAEEGWVPAYPGAAVEVSMGFSGPLSGTLVMAVAESLCAELAANALGLEVTDDLVRKNPYDAVQELLNVTCGNLLTAIAGEEPVFVLTVPQLLPQDEAGWMALARSEGVVAVLADDRPVLLRLTMVG